MERETRRGLMCVEGLDISLEPIVLYVVQILVVISLSQAINKILKFLKQPLVIAEMVCVLSCIFLVGGMVIMWRLGGLGGVSLGGGVWVLIICS